MFTVDPSGGLCNRLRVLDSAIALAKAIDKPLHLIWRKNNRLNELNCNFSSLFIIPSVIKKLSEPYTPHIVKKIIKKLHLYQLKYQKTYFQKDVESLLKINYNFENFRNSRSIYISTLSKFYRNPHPFFDLVPKPEITTIVNDIVRGFDFNTIGVHIRRADNLRSKSVSTIKKFEARMNLEMTLNPTVNFFLATDDLNVETFFRGRFKNKIIVYPKREIKRSIPLAIEDALIDLLCLSKTKKILGSYWSSFTETASQINNVDLFVVK